MENIKGILVTALAPMDHHIANAGEKLLGNASSIKARPDEKVYISGQMQRHALFSAIDRLNQDDPDRNNTYVSNGDGISNKIEVDLRADMGGFMHPKAESYSSRRIAPLSATPAVAIEPSQKGRDLLIRLKENPNNQSRDQALATNEFSTHDIMHMNFFLDITNLSTSKKYSYEDEFHIKTEYIKHATENERKRRVRLYIEATRSLTDYANQARNAVSGEPQKVLIVLDTKLSRKGARYFHPKATEQERNNILAELQERGAKHFLGDDTNGDKSVAQAYKEALSEFENSTLFDPAGGDDNIKTFEKTFNNAD
ncbi:MAG: type I-PGING CRISPR-associated protein Cas7/Csp1 [Candidatus Woesearchaeota archaeon]